MGRKEKKEKKKKNVEQHPLKQHKKHQFVVISIHAQNKKIKNKNKKYYHYC